MFFLPHMQMKRRFLVGRMVRQLRAENPNMPNAEISRIVKTDPRYVYRLIGVSPKHLIVCKNCGVPIKSSWSLSFYKSRLCENCRPNGHKLRRDPIYKFTCQRCKIIFERKLHEIVDEQKRGFVPLYCSNPCKLNITKLNECEHVATQ